MNLSIPRCQTLVSYLTNLGTYCLALTVIALGAPSPRLQAQIVDWTNTTGTPDPWYHIGSNWVGGAAPTSSQTARFNQAGTYEVWWDSLTASNAPDVGFLDITQGDVTFLNTDGGVQHLYTINGSGGTGAFSDFSISGSGTSLTNGGMHLRSLGGGEILGGATLTLDGSHLQGSRLTVDGTTGFNVSGNLNVLSGAIFDNTNGYIGYQSGSTGNATVTGSGSQWNNSGGLRVGFQGSGNLNVEDGGVVSNTTGSIGYQSGSTGTVTVTGLGSQWNQSSSLYVGDQGTGTLNIAAGGQVSNTQGYIGFNDGTTGIATVTGTGSQWNNSSRLRVGDAGNGTLNIQDGGVVSNTFGSIGYIGGSTGVATVTGTGSQWNNSGALQVGYEGNGTLNVEAGGIVNNTTGSIAESFGSTGAATVTGTDSQWNNSNGLFLGGTDTSDGGVGTLTLADNGQVNVGDDLFLLGNTLSALTISDSGTNGNLWVRNGSTITNAGVDLIGFNAGSTGTATVTGSGSQWNSGAMYIGYYGNGTVNIDSGGEVNTGGAAVGALGVGVLNVDSGGVVTTSVETYVGLDSGGIGIATVTGSGSQWNNTSSLYLGFLGTGNGTLNIVDGGVVSNSDGYIGFEPDATGIATITGAGSQWNQTSSLRVGDGGDGMLNIEAGGVVRNTDAYIGNQSSATGAATVTGTGSQWINSGALYVGRDGIGTLVIEDGGLVSNTIGYIGHQTSAEGTATVSGTGSQWNNSGVLYIGEKGFFSGAIGTLRIEAGGLVTNTDALLGKEYFSTGIATVTGSGSRWINSGFLTVGDEGNGSLTIEAGGLVSNTTSSIGAYGSTGIVTVTGNGSQWNLSSNLRVGVYDSSNGTLNIEDGGVVSNTDSLIAFHPDATGTVTVTGSGSHWNNSGDLQVGLDGTGTLNVNSGGLVSVGGTTRIGSFGSINIGGGRLEFGGMSLVDYARLNGTSGSLAGGIVLNGFNALSDVTTNLPSHSSLDTSEVYLANDGLLYGSGIAQIALTNNIAGEVELISGDRMRFTGGGNANSGTINLLGGLLHFTQDFTNNAGGLIVGNGSLRADGGMFNDGTMGFSATANVLGDLTNNANGLIITSGGTTTFFDDVINDGEIRTNANSFTVYYGSFSGAGSNTGPGTVIIEADLKPGNSPAIVSFGGDLQMGVNASTFIELGGLDAGSYDQLLVEGDFLLDGSLDVSLIDGFNLGFNQEFLIADITGSRTGFFDGLGEGDLVGNYGGMDLFISYGAGNGNDVSLFTAVPEPGTAGVIALMMLGVAMRRRRLDR